MKYEFDEVVVGASFGAVYLAYTEGLPIIYQKKERPFYEDYVEDVKKIEYYDYMLSLMTLSNLNLFSDKVADIKIEGNMITVSGKKPWVAEVKANKIHNFLSEESKNCIVVDYINVRSCGPHSYRVLDDRNYHESIKQIFVKQLAFYPSERTLPSINYLFKDENPPYEKIVKDIRAVSYLSRNNLEKEDFSPTYAVIKTKKMMKDVGLRGRKKGFENRPGKKFEQRYGPLDLEFEKREVYPVDENQYVFTLKSKNEYIAKLIESFYDRRQRRSK